VPKITGLVIRFKIKIKDKNLVQEDFFETEVYGNENKEGEKRRESEAFASDSLLVFLTVIHCGNCNCIFQERPLPVLAWIFLTCRTGRYISSAHYGRAGTDE
jgi:hypothetical protein